MEQKPPIPPDPEIPQDPPRYRIPTWMLISFIVVGLSAVIAMLFWPTNKPAVKTAAPVVKTAPAKKSAVKAAATKAPMAPEAPVVIHNYNVQSAELPPIPPAPAPSVTIYNYNIQGSAQLAQPAATLCPKVGYYVLSHEPTTDSRQYDDRRNWIPGHMELVRECRNGALSEFSRWVGHSLP